MTGARGVPGIKHENRQNGYIRGVLSPKWGWLVTQNPHPSRKILVGYGADSQENSDCEIAFEAA
jgi:hypothetical protein